YLNDADSGRRGTGRSRFGLGACDRQHAEAEHQEQAQGKYTQGYSNSCTCILTHYRYPFLFPDACFMPSCCTRQDTRRAGTTRRLTYFSRRDGVWTISLWSYRDWPLVLCQSSVILQESSKATPGWHLAT